MGIKEILGGGLKKKFSDLFYSQEAAVTGVSDFIQPVVDLDKPVCDIVRATSANNTTVTIYTTPTDKDFFLTDVWKSVETIPNINYITITVGGATHQILKSNAATHDTDFNFCCPIKIDRGTNILLTSGAATIVYATIFGYTKDSFDKK